MINKELEQETKTEAITTKDTNRVVKLSDFLKEYNAYDSYIEQSVGYFKDRDINEVSTKRVCISNTFDWNNSKEGSDYWEELSLTFRRIANKEYDMTDLIKELVIKVKEQSQTEVKDTKYKLIPSIEQETQPEPKTEYFVFVQNKNPPKVTHSTLASAEKEAIRLSGS